MFKLSLAAVAAVALMNGGAAQARGGMASEDLWNPQHIAGLPSEVRNAVYQRCGSTVHAQHSFATYFDQSRRLRLHFENAHCGAHELLCNQSGCLHQDYILSGGHYRLLRTYYGSGSD